MTNNSNVKIVDGKLILSLPEAQTPVVWQIDIEKAQSASFTVKENKKEKNFDLVFKGSDGSTDNIAPFDEKQSAVDILMETSNVLQNAHGQIKPAANNNAVHTSTGKQNDKLGAILAVALIIVLITIWSFSAMGPGRIGEGGYNPSSSSASNTSSDPRQSSGVAVSADEFLTNR